MKKIFFLLSAIILIVYIGIIRNGFTILIGLGTPYSYFEAQKTKHDSILIFYTPVLDHPIPYINYDSLCLKYKFRWVYGGAEVPSSVIQLYNSVIEKELHRRLGKRWNEYLFKVDSIQSKKGFGVVRPPR